MIELLGFPMAASGRVDIYSGVARMAGKVWGSLHRGEKPSKTVLVVVHPSSNFLGHYLLAPFAERGVDAVGLTTRYIGNDSSLLMENCVLDIGVAIRFLRERGYEKVVLIGNSGGGGLSAFYQSQAESPTVTQTPAGDPPDLTQADLPPVDALLELMAHPGRALVYTDWLDPAVTDEHDPFARDLELDIISGAIPPPFTPNFLERYRGAQLARNRRITAWVRDQLARLDADGGDLADLPSSCTAPSPTRVSSTCPSIHPTARLARCGAQPRPPTSCRPRWGTTPACGHGLASGAWTTRTATVRCTSAAPMCRPSSCMGRPIRCASRATRP